MEITGKMYLIIRELHGIFTICAMDRYAEILKQFADIKPLGSEKYIVIQCEQITAWKGILNGENKGTR